MCPIKIVFNAKKKEEERFKIEEFKSEKLTSHSGSWLKTFICTVQVHEKK